MIPLLEIVGRVVTSRRERRAAAERLANEYRLTPEAAERRSGRAALIIQRAEEERGEARVRARFSDSPELLAVYSPLFIHGPYVGRAVFSDLPQADADLTPEAVSAMKSELAEIARRERLALANLAEASG